MALQKAGIDARVVEAHALDSGDIGSYLSVAPNGLDALDVIDARPSRSASGSATAAMCYAGAPAACSATSRSANRSRMGRRRSP